MKRFWKVTQGSSTARVAAVDHAAAVERAEAIGFGSPDSVVLDTERFDLAIPEHLQMLFTVHTAGGPRALWKTMHGTPGVQPTTREVEDSAIAFYTAYNATFGRTF
jgi:hypothetical protein